MRTLWESTFSNLKKKKEERNRKEYYKLETAWEWGIMGDRPYLKSTPNALCAQFNSVTWSPKSMFPIASESLYMLFPSHNVPLHLHVY